MNAWLSACAVIVLAVALGVAGAHRARTPAQRSMAAGHCAGCHADTPPVDHTAEFIERGHGPIGRGDANQCVGCHDDRAAHCDPCHATDEPSWHTQLMREPWRSLRARDEHASKARERRERCAGCHVARFQRQCAGCHRRDEAWTGIAPGATP